MVNFDHVGRRVIPVESSGHPDAFHGMPWSLIPYCSNNQVGIDINKLAIKNWLKDAGVKWFFAKFRVPVRNNDIKES